jgi:GNAT superfamily N-acetyltransferase
MISIDGFVFASERVAAVWGEVLPLLAQHWVEVSNERDFPFLPDAEFYCKADESGLLRSFTVRDKARTLIGYAVYFVTVHQHHKQIRWAQQDGIFIRKDRRGFGSRFISWCDDQLKQEGVRLISRHVKAGHDFSPALKRLGYEIDDIIYVRRFN